MIEEHLRPELDTRLLMEQNRLLAQISGRLLLIMCTLSFPTGLVFTIGLT